MTAHSSATEEALKLARIVVQFHEANTEYEPEVVRKIAQALVDVRSEMATPSRDAIIEECAALIEPVGEPPCGCLRPGSYGGCECSNTGNLQQEEAYWSSKGDAERIRWLKGNP